MIRLTIPSIEADDLQAVSETLATGYLVQGPRVADFESMVVQVAGTDYAVAVSNCTAALHLALLALDVRPGDLVVVAAYSWPATGNVVELCGAQPVFVDIEPDTFNLSPAALETTLQRLITTPAIANRIKAVLPVHTFGQMADMEAITTLASRYGLPVIEDAACALGATTNGRPAGSVGVMGCFSFHPRKAVTTGEGGVITTNDERLARTLKALRNHGLDPDAPTSDFIMPGFNYRMTEFQAALGVTQMRKLERIVQARRERAARYDHLLANTPLQAPKVADGHTHVYQSYITLLPKEAAPHRATLIARLAEQGIQTTIGTYHLPMTTYFRTRYGFRAGDFPAADDVYARALTLPLHEHLTAEEQETVVQQICNELGRL